ncbi:hypothetical protein [Agrobacterium sp.]|uniref:hypothetical protein n=1 Tax=Agrobacterium sp. TaxID=361 RepID=UPI0028AA4A86|nr:hypothetical protein [Agrobacterium sp.]
MRKISKSMLSVTISPILIMLLFSVDALADVRCMTMQGDSWVNGCNADIQFTHTDCEGGVAKLKVKQAEKPRYSPYLARQNKQKNCTVTILSECVTEDIASGICTLELTNPYLE